MFRIILHANDGSNPAFRALELAIALAKQNAAALHLVCVEEIPPMPEYIEEGTKPGESRLAVSIRSSSGHAFRPGKVASAFRVHVVSGHPVRIIVDLVDEVGADLLVIGATGHSAL
jgi:nucleotide-binding universal stress UspA family protein